MGLAPTLTGARCSADVVLGLIKPGEQMVIYESFTDSQQNIKLRHDRGERGALFCAKLLPAPPSGARGCTRGRQKKRRCCGATTAQRPLRLASGVCVLVGWTPNKSPDGSQVFNVGIEGLEVRTCSRSCQRAARGVRTLAPSRARALQRPPQQRDAPPPTPDDGALC